MLKFVFPVALACAYVEAVPVCAHQNPVFCGVGNETDSGFERRTGCVQLAGPQPVGRISLSYLLKVDAA